MSTSTADVVGVVLAGGLSRRMGGGDKSLLDLAGRPMLAHVIDRLRPQVSQVVLSANGDLTRFSGFRVPALTDTIHGPVGLWPAYSRVCSGLGRRRL
jgi:molybdopterin-guanine dinucleotide biosynthesis protein A